MPRGTIIYPLDRSKDGQPSKRDLVVKVTAISGFTSPLDYKRLLPEADREDFTRAAYSLPGYPWSGWGSGRMVVPNARQTTEAGLAKAAERTKGDTRYVEWGTSYASRKMALIADVVACDAPTRKAPSTAPSLRETMVKGSVWRFVRDAEIRGRIDNPAYRTEFNKISATVRNPYHELARRGVERIIDGVVATVSAGETFTVTGKMGLPLSYLGGTGTFDVPTNFRGKSFEFPFSAISGLIEAVSIPTVKTYVLRDTATGLFYAGPGNSWRTTPAPTYVSDYRKSLRFDAVGKVKQYVLGMIGYRDGLTESAEGIPYYQETQRLYDLPPTWEIVVFDKLTRMEIPGEGAVFDLQGWHTRTLRMRELTKRYGSPVRSVYSAAEKSGTLGQYEAILAAHVAIDERSNSYTEELPGGAIHEMLTMLVGFGCTKADMRRSKGKHGFAILLKEAKHAFNAMMFYDGPLTLVALDVTNLTELVAPAA